MPDIEKKLVNLMEDNGNVHDDEELRKSIQTLSPEQKKHLSE